MRLVVALLVLLAATPAYAQADGGSCPLEQQSPFDDLVHATFVGSPAGPSAAAHGGSFAGWASIVDRPVHMTIQNGPKCALYALQAVMQFETNDGSGVPVVDRPATMAKYERGDEFGPVRLLPFPPPPAQTLLHRIERSAIEALDRTGVAVAAFGAQDALFDAARIDGDTVDGSISPAELVDLAHHYGFRAQYVPGDQASLSGIEQAVREGTPVITGFLVDRDGNPCTKIGGDCLGKHAVVIEGFGVARDGTRWVIAKHGWSSTPFVWRESDFDRSRQAAGAGLAIVDPKI